jgi:hypothetical protein
MIRERWTLLTATAALFLLAGCDSEPTQPMRGDTPAELSAIRGATTEGWDLPLMSAAALTREFPGRPCNEPLHRQFDFWVGEWNVFNTSNEFIGTNVVTSELDGCLVQEHWIGSNGTRGRSLNTYDSETGQWHQDWASQIPVPSALTGRLRTAGGIVDGTMVLDGVRHATGGFTFLDHWTWSVDAGGNVIQSSLTSIPEFNLEFPFTGVYVAGTPQPIQEQITANCQAGQAWGETRMGDFLVGSYAVYADAGVEVGSATIETDLSDCVFVEQFQTRGGLRATSFTYYDAWVEAWFRIYVDSEGERLALRGGFDGSSLVLTGTEGSAAGDVDVRLGWTPQGNDVVQTWEVSRDGGATWRETARLVYAASAG